MTLWDKGFPWLRVLAASWSPGRVRQRSLSFGDDPRQRVIAFIPKEPRPGPWVYFLFGGGWTSGSARAWSFAGNWFARHGVPAVVGGYRLAPAHRFPAQLDDALAGFAFAGRHAAELGLDGRPAVLSGASAGGHLAALAAIRSARAAATPHASAPIVRADGLLLISAALDLMIAHTPRGDAAIEALTGHRPPWPEADPLTWIVTEPPHADAIPPTMLVRGDIDELVAPAGAEAFAAALNAVAPSRAEVVRAPWRRHVDLTRLFLDRDPALTASVMEWMSALTRGDHDA